jgi:hypothetical protein
MEDGNEQPVFYHFTDPIQNLRVRVRLRQIKETDDTKRDDDDDGPRESRGETTDLDNEANEGMVPKDEYTNEWDRDFDWQEKVFGPRELLKFYPKEGGKKKKWSSRWLDGQYSKNIDDLNKSYNQGDGDGGNEAKGLLDDLQDETVMLFSYTDKDGFLPRSGAFLTVPILLTELVLAVPIFLTELALTVPIFLTEFVLTILIFRTELLLY